jgi:hypothetical protein
MKNPTSIRLSAVLFLIAVFPMLNSCSDDNDTIVGANTESQTLSTADVDALLFMLEEEKLARDTYIYLDNLWSINQFANIQNSEQTHMNAVENLLIANNIDYIILPEGEFADPNLQAFYNQFIANGAVSSANALQIGATIEDLDIVDLGEYMEVTTNEDLLLVFESLQCGSRNHLRSFHKAIENAGNTYVPLFLSPDEYQYIVSGSHEQCN